MSSKWDIHRSSDNEIALKKKLNKLEAEVQKYQVQLRRKDKLIRTNPNNTLSKTRKTNTVSKDERDMLNELKNERKEQQREINRLRAQLRLKHIGATKVGDKKEVVKVDLLLIEILLKKMYQTII